MASSTRTRHGEKPQDVQSNSWAEAYFRWLKSQVKEDGRRKNGYQDLFRILHDTEFVWIVPNDDNRIMDALNLRVEFFHKQKSRGKEMVRPCSVLEVTVALSRRLAWLVEGSAEGWAWQLLCNLELHKFRDPLSRRKEAKVEDILYSLIWRTYDPDGTGGYFPLTRPKRDQRTVEIWYQMHAYVGEFHPEY